MPANRLLPVALLALISLWSCLEEPNNLVDFDGDGSLDQNDCQPANPAVYPGAADGYGDGIDSNCDGVDGNAVVSQNSAGLDVHRSVRFGSWPYCSLFDRDSTIPRLLLIDGRRPRSSFGTPRGQTRD